MKIKLVIIGLLFSLSLDAQSYNKHFSVDFAIDSSRKPLFCFHYKPLPENSYRWGFYHSTDITKGKLPFKTSRIYAAGRNSDTMVCNNFRDSMGMYWVCLETGYTNGTKDTICTRILNNFDASNRLIALTNVFTPDSLGSINFNVNIKNESEYRFVIFNRFGAKVFDSKSKDYSWNGKVHNTGDLCPDGTYYYLLEYRLNGKTENEPPLNGNIRLIR